MSFEEKLARRLLLDRDEELDFVVELRDEAELESVRKFFEKWGCSVERIDFRPRLRVIVTPECASGAN